MLIAALLIGALVSAGETDVHPVLTHADAGGDAEAVTVRVGEQPVAVFAFGEQVNRPAAFPLTTPSGVRVTRRFPPRRDEGETTDHWHHTGLFVATDVGPVHFWASIEDRPGIETTGVGVDGPTIVSTHEWRDADEALMLNDRRVYRFGLVEGGWFVDVLVELRAGEQGPVTIPDTKEGLLGLRLRDELREPGSGGTGRYFNAAGAEGEAGCWGRRSPWLCLVGEVDGAPVSVAILEHPTSFNAPSHWHARGYGLFAVNPVGQGVFDAHHAERARGAAGNTAPVDLTIDGAGVRFAYRVVVADGTASAGVVAAWQAAFAAEALPAVSGE